MSQILFRSVSFIFILAFAGCSAGLDSGKRMAYVDSHPELEVIHAEAIMNAQIMVGMSQEMVVAAWGNPSRTEDELKIEEEAATCWVYGNAFMGSTITELFFNGDGDLVRYEVNALQQHANTGSSSSAGGDVARSVLSGSGDRLTKDGGAARP